MVKHEYRFLQSVFTSAAIGGFVMLAVVTGVLAFDVLSIATMIGASAEKALVSTLFIGGALTKGLAFGAAFGLAFAIRGRSAAYEASARSAGVVAS